MTTYFIDQGASQKLVSLPESGMGYQIVGDGNRIWVCFNAIIAVPMDELRGLSFGEAENALLARDLSNEPISTELPRAEFGRDLRIAFSLLDSGLRDPAVDLSFPYSVTSPMPPRPRKPPAAYYRFSAFYRDRRIAPDGNFLPGTYATTFSDMRTVPSGLAAVGRYALPNPASARFLYSVVTYSNPTHLGAVTPNFGQSGGGVEALFNAGAKNTHGACFPIAVG